MKKIVSKAFVLIFIISLMNSCKKDDDVVIKEEFKPTVLSSDVTQLFELRGNPTSSIVWIYVQGGPVVQRDLLFEEKNSDGTDMFPYITDDLRVYPFQVQHLNEQIKTFNEFTLEQAKIESAKNAEIVRRVAGYFESQNKTVYIVGHSYGAFVVNEVLVKYGAVGRKMASLNGRLNMDQVVWEGFSKGEEWLFDQNGQNPSLNSGADNSVLEKNMRKLAAGLGFNRYTQKLAEVDLSDAIFLTADKDKFVGDFTQETLDFLAPKAESLIILQNSEHSEIFNEASLFEQLHDDMIQDN